MRRTIPATPIGLRQRRHIAAVRLDAALQVPVHRGVIRIGDYDCVARRLKRLRHPLALGAGLEHDPHRTETVERVNEPLTRRQDSLIAQDHAGVVDDPNLAVPQMKIDGTIHHGWLLLCECPVSAGRYSVCGAQATTLRWQPAASSHLGG